MLYRPHLNGYFQVYKLIFLSIILLMDCSKDSFPRITKIKIVKSVGTCSHYLQIVDLSDDAHKSCGVEFSQNKSFNNSTIITKLNPKKGDTFCLSFPTLPCNGVYFIKPYCYNNNQLIYGMIDSINFTQAINPPTILSLDTSIAEKITVNYNLSNYSSTAAIKLYFNINSSSAVSFKDSFRILLNKSGNNSIAITPIQNGSVYKFQIFVTDCSKDTSSAVKSISTPIKKLCNAPSSSSLDLFQKCKTKVLMRGSLTTNTTIVDYGFFINNSYISCSNQSSSNFTYDSTASGSVTALLYYKCSGKNNTTFGSPKAITLLNPQISISKATSPSQNTIEVTGSFSIPNYQSDEYGICFSNTVSVPTIANNKVVLGSSFSTNTNLYHKFTATPDITYYLRFYIKDCDGILYSNIENYKIISPPTYCNLNICNLSDYVSGKPTKFNAAFLINGYLYVGGGNTDNISSPLFYMYNGNTWIRKEDMPISSGSPYGICAYFTIANNAYVLERNSYKFINYNEINKSWKNIPFNKNKRQNCPSISSSTKGYIIGGQDQNNQPIYEMLEFNPNGTNGNTWTSLNYDANLNERINSCAFIIGDSIYLFGGSGNNDFWYYKITGDKWGKINNFPLPSGLYNYENGNVFVHNGIAYILKQNDSIFYVFDPKKGWDTCNNLLMTQHRKFGFSVYDNSNAYIGLGIDTNGNSLFDVIKFQ